MAKCHATHLYVLCSVSAFPSNILTQNFECYVTHSDFIFLLCLGAQRKGMVIIMSFLKRSAIVVIFLTLIIILNLYIPRSCWIENGIIDKLGNNIYIPDRMSDDYYKDVIWGGHKMWKYELSTKEMDMASVYIDNGDFKKINEDTFDYIKSCWYASCTLTKFDFRMGFRHINVMDSYRYCAPYNGNYAEFILDVSNKNYYILVFHD